MGYRDVFVASAPNAMLWGPHPLPGRPPMLVLPSNERLASPMAQRLTTRMWSLRIPLEPASHPDLVFLYSLWPKNFHPTCLCLLLDASPHRHTKFSLDAANVSSQQNLRTHPGFSDPCSVVAAFLAGLFRRNSAGHCIGVHRITISDTRATGPMASVCGKAVRPTDHAGGFAQGPSFICFTLNIVVLP